MTEEAIAQNQRDIRTLYKRTEVNGTALAVFGTRLESIDNNLGRLADSIAADKANQDKEKKAEGSTRWQFIAGVLTPLIVGAVFYLIKFFAGKP